LLDWRARTELARGLGVGIIPGRLPGNGKGSRGATMIELPKMSVEEFSGHLQEALS
jgi:hypothetical protein